MSNSNVKVKEVSKKQKIKKFKPHKGVDIDVNHNPEAKNDFTRIVDKKGKYVCSIKHDGWRGFFKDGRAITSKLNDCPNKQVHEKFAELKELSKEFNVILDCEFDDPNLDLSQINGIMRSKNADLGNIKPYFFDIIHDENFDLGYAKRLQNLKDFMKNRDYKVVEHKICNNVEEILEYFQESMDKDLEGIIARHEDSPYKFGRSTLESGDLFKLKGIVTYDAKIIDIKFNKHRKVNYGEPILLDGKHKMAGTIIGIWTNLEGKKVEVKISCNTMKNPYRAKVWRNRKSLIGQWVEFKAKAPKKLLDKLPSDARYFRFRDNLDKSE